MLLTPISDNPTAFMIASAIKVLVFFGVYLVTVALLTLAERKVSAWIQDRHGPNRTGPGGLLQPAADGLKNFMKEELSPGSGSSVLFSLAPAIAFCTALVSWAVIPFAAPLPTPWGVVPLAVADVPVGFIFTLAISSLGVFGITIAGWSSNNKYSLLGGLRSSAQMISYEISMGLSVIPVLLLAGNVTLSSIIAQQATGGWNALNLSFAFLTFLISAFAETNRLPFDLPEAESELVAGYHTEYSSMKFAMFFIAEYANMLTASGLMATLFLGGWDIPFTAWDNTGDPSVLKTVLTLLSFAVKTGFFLFFYMWIRWTVPRFRYDQLMSLGWRFLLPVSLGYIVLIATALLVLQLLGIQPGIVQTGVLFTLNVIVLVLVFVVFDRGRLISPTTTKVSAAELVRLRAQDRVVPALAAATRAEPGMGD
ncbi:MAG TPA: NADH-quinone oxidoreductase subunit NuoH [Gemmatimonadaceae bacterium]|nr:NADH-quinone oxidoreductase subunit NuoH [Gemmatimonadaceae bacterium]